MLRAIFIISLAILMADRASADPLRIMPLGDSITAGNGDNHLLR